MVGDPSGLGGASWLVSHQAGGIEYACSEEERRAWKRLHFTKNVLLWLVGDHTIGTFSVQVVRLVENIDELVF